MTPSYVAFTDTERLIGDAAKNQVAMNPTNTVFDAKRLIGRRFSDPSVQADMKLWPFKVIPGPAEKPMVVVTYKGEEKQFSAEEIYSMVLTTMKEIVETFLGTTIKNAVVTVPDFWVESNPDFWVQSIQNWVRGRRKEEKGKREEGRGNMVISC